MAGPPGVDPQVVQWFQAVDMDRSGRITALELQQALTNTNWTHFNADTCTLMIGNLLLMWQSLLSYLLLLLDFASKSMFLSSKLFISISELLDLNHDLHHYKPFF